ncbi:hypothetical protein [Bradyrhizobium sp. HKCCYLS20291]|uniref:hypothetical protein n=1 Tax=Bradyrhizobium sp. HKCCYLS20291 TaxID=3420766 RepID=UPI003EB93643
MTNGKTLGALMICLVVLWASRFAPQSCAPASAPSWTAFFGSALLVTGFLFCPVYDFVALLAYKLGMDRQFTPIEVFAGEFPPPDQPPVSLKTKLWFLYPLDIIIVLVFLLPLWDAAAYCG